MIRSAQAPRTCEYGFAQGEGGKCEKLQLPDQFLVETGSKESAS